MLSINKDIVAYGQRRHTEKKKSHVSLMNADGDARINA